MKVSIGPGGRFMDKIPVMGIFVCYTHPKRIRRDDLSEYYKVTAQKAYYGHAITNTSVA